MKTLKILSMLLAAFLLMPAFVSCDKDNDKDEPKDIDHVTGSYSGTMVATVSAMGNVWDNIDMTGVYEVKISSKDNASNKVVVSLPECSYTPPMSDKAETIPAITIDNVEVKDKGNGIYSLYKDEYAVAVNGVQYTVKIYDYDKGDKEREDGTTIAGRDIRLVYSITPGKMPGFINFTFTGTLK